MSEKEKAEKEKAEKEKAEKAESPKEKFNSLLKELRSVKSLSSLVSKRK